MYRAYESLLPMKCIDVDPKYSSGCIVFNHPSFVFFSLLLDTSHSILRSYEVHFQWLPSGKRLHNYGKSPCLMGKLTISMAIFNSYVAVYQRLNLN